MAVVSYYLGNRRTGRTFRLCLRALLAASETDGSLHLVVVPTYAWGDHVFRMLAAQAESVHATISRERSVELANGSRIRVITDEGYGRLVGTKVDRVFVDQQ